MFFYNILSYFCVFQSFGILVILIAWRTTFFEVENVRRSINKIACLQMSIWIKKEGWNQGIYNHFKLNPVYKSFRDFLKIFIELRQSQTVEKIYSNQWIILYHTLYTLLMMMKMTSVFFFSNNNITQCRS